MEEDVCGKEGKESTGLPGTMMLGVVSLPFPAGVICGSNVAYFDNIHYTS